MNNPFRNVARFLLASLLLVPLLFQTVISQNHPNLFQPFTYEWPTPNDCRLGSGAPGPGYWQQQADYDMDVTLDEKERRISGSASIVYHNNSPHTLTYIWLQLDQDKRKPHAIAGQLESVFEMEEADEAFEILGRNQPSTGGYVIGNVQTTEGDALDYLIGETNMRIDLPQPLKAGENFSFSLEWRYNLNDAKIEGRSGYEHFVKDNNDVFEIAQFYPRLCAYDDANGWQNHPFYGPGEFALEFGDFKVRITAPEDMLVAATGTLENPTDVLTKKQRKRWEKMLDTREEVHFIVTPEEAEAAEKQKGTEAKTWEFQANRVRDFAFAASRKFVWDAAVVELSGRPVIAQSLYPKEGMPLWDHYATQTIIHTLKTYSHFSVDYPYPQATAVHGAVWGMEYPMICFCGGRPASPTYYSRTTKYRMIGVIIHEVGHNFFPMIVNSDERRWAWMDEGLNSYLEYMTEKTWEPNFPHRRGPADDFAFTMMVTDQDPIMTNPESIRENGVISYTKVATGLKILREEILGPERFDFAFGEYSRRWAFKRPQPADFFRSIEDASGVDLDWFWRGWWYDTRPVDFSIEKVSHFALDKEPGLEKPFNVYPEISPEAATKSFFVDGKEQLQDEYTGQPLDWDASQSLNERTIQTLLDNQTPLSGTAFHVYQILLKNNTGIVMPLSMDVVYIDGSRSSHRLPAQLWMKGDSLFRYEYHAEKQAVAFYLDGRRMLPDVDRSDNLYPQPKLDQAIETKDWRGLEED